MGLYEASARRAHDNRRRWSHLGVYKVLYPDAYEEVKASDSSLQLSRRKLNRNEDVIGQARRAKRQPRYFSLLLVVTTRHSLISNL